MVSPDSPGDAVRTVAIIGAGFSGAMVAAQLLRQHSGGALRILLIDRTGAFGPGLAYGTHNEAHALNVPAWNMSALPADPEHFLRFCRSSDAAFTPRSFAPRWLYGRYLEFTLREAQGASGAALERIRAEVTAIDLNGGDRPRLAFADGSSCTVDRIVLATGHQLSRQQPFGVSFDRLPMYVHDPWSTQVTDRLAASDSVLLIGSGHTAVDVLFALLQSNPARRVVMLSRHGLLPRDYGDASSVAAPAVQQPMAGSIREQLRRFRRRARQAGNSANDWHLGLRELRPVLPALWHQLPVTERQRFLRHLRPWWDVHRHRLGPLAALRLRQSLERGRVEVVAGRPVDALYLGSVARVTVAGRGGRRDVLDVNRIVNCTGPCYDVARSAHGLLRNLLGVGAIRADALGLGLDVDGDYRPLSADGTPSARMRYIGPLLRARDWEAIAVPELRSHAARLAALVLADLRSTRPTATPAHVAPAVAPHDLPVLKQPLGVA